MVGQRRDDKQRSFLKTLLGQVAPRETVFPRGNCLSKDTLQVLRVELPMGVIRNELTPDKEFWDAKTTIRQLEQKKYFAQPTSSVPAAATDAQQHWPAALKQIIASKQHLAVSALGAVTFYLERTMHAHDLLSLGNMNLYLDAAGSRQCLLLDGQTLANLEVLKNQQG